jgi:hypothetical protein
VIGAGLVSRFDRLRQALWRARRPELDRRSPAGKLPDPEMRTIVALAEVLIPADGAPDKLKRIIESHVDDRTASVPGY